MESEKSIQIAFQTVPYSFDAFNRWLYSNPEAPVQEVASNLRSCIARTTKGFIIKRQMENSWRYEMVPMSQAKTLFGFMVPIEVPTETVVNKQVVKFNKKEYKSLFAVLTNPLLAPQLAFYNDLELMSSDPNILSAYVPPQGDYDDEFAKELIEFMRSRVRNKRAFDDEISSHAYRLRHPEAFIEKCYVHHSTQGKTGKSFLVETLSLLYPHLANVGVKHTQLTENCSGWSVDYLMINVEELEGTEYVDKKFAGTVKQMTTRNTSVRKMYHDTTSGKNNAILSLNTNQADLYGLATTNDEAVVTRLCILMFEKPLTDQEWDAAFCRLGIHESKPGFQQNRAKMASSLYHYLKHTYQIVDGYTPSRYNHPEKQDVLRELREKCSSLPLRFINCLAKETEESDSIESQYKVFEMYRDKRSKSNEVKRVVAMKLRLNNAWKSFMEGRRGSQSTYSFEKSVEPLLLHIGFKETRIARGLAWVCEDVAKFNDWYDKRAKPEVLDMSDVEPIQLSASSSEDEEIEFE